LSKTGQDNTAITTLVKGTWGVFDYLDPDYARRRQLTERSDVYSFGVVLFEVLCARKALDKKVETEQWHLANWVRKCIERETIGRIIDPYLKGKIAPQCFQVYVEVAESCVRDQTIQRPTMNDVMEKLIFALELQENADAAKEKINPDGEHNYPEVVSFSVADTISVSRSNSGCTCDGHVLETDSGTGLTTIDIGLTHPDFDAITSHCSQDVTDSSAAAPTPKDLGAFLHVFPKCGSSSIYEGLIGITFAFLGYVGEILWTRLHVILTYIV
jgi:serine/threonine protein kinase